MNISVLILTYDEAINLPDCLRSVAFSDDVVVLDSRSTDQTVEIVESAGATVLQRPFDNYAAQRNFGLSHDFKYDWILMLDADERIPADFVDELRSVTEQVGNPVTLYRMRRKDMFMGRWLKRSSGYPTWFGRLFRKGAVRVEREIIPWPVELVDCSDKVRRRDKIRAELKIPHEAKVLIYFGRLHTMKKPLETIQAVASGGDENLHLLIVGNEQDVSLRDCYELACQLGVGDRVHLVGPVYGERKYDYLLAADAYISLSHRENFNHTAAESLSAGLPLILSPGNDLQGDIAAEKCSWGLCDDERGTASDAVEQFCSVPSDQLAQMGTRGRDWVGRNLQFPTFAERIQSAASKYGKIK